MKKLLIGTGGALAVFAAGWFLGARPTDSGADRAAGPDPPAEIAEAGAGAATLAELHALPGAIARGRALAELVATADAASVRALLEALVFARRDEYHTLALPLLLERWVELDADGALAWVRHRAPAFRRTEDLRLLFEIWMAKDFDAALAAARAAGDPGVLRAAENAAATQLAASDPPAAWALLESRPFVWGSQESHGPVLAAWAQADFPAAVAAVLALPGGEARRNLLMHLVGVLARADPAAALEWAGGLPYSSERRLAGIMALGALAEQDPRAAAAALARLPGEMNPLNQLESPRSSALFGIGEQTLHSLVADWAAQDAPAALAWAEALPQGLARNLALDSLIGQVGQTHPAAAAEILALLPASERPPAASRAAQTLARHWARQDAAGALAWAESLSDPPPAGVQRIVLEVWSGTDPAAAGAYLAGRVNHPDFENLAGGFVSRWAASDAASAIAWAAALPPGGERDQALGTAISTLGWANSAAALAYARALPEGATRHRVQVLLSGTLRTRDPAAAAALLTTVPESPELNRAIAGVAADWAQADPLAASQWIATLPDGAARDHAVGRLVAAESAHDPPATYEWALTIHDDGLRHNAIRTALTSWAKTDATAALEAVAEAPLTDTQRRALREQIEQAARR